MKFILKINGTESPKAAYVGWTPVKCTLSIDKISVGSPISVTIITGHDEDKKGRLSLYYSNSTSSEPIDTIEHNFQDQESLTFYVAGKFPHASVTEKDTFITVEQKSIGDKSVDIEPLTRRIMVRVRKNANELTEEEVRIFLESFARLNLISSRQKYEGDYVVTPSKLLHEIVLMHTYDAQREIHQRSSFHPWHRAYLIHLERELQTVDPRVTIPYWKFDEKAEVVFTEKFIGKTEKTKVSEDAPFEDRLNENMRPKFDQSNPMYSYKDHTAWGPLRRAYFDKDPAQAKPLDRILDQSQIICDPDNTKQFLKWFDWEERGSHNGGHVAFTGHVVDAGRDPVDPLFFMLHSNVDRLWAMWQHEYSRFNGNKKETYPFQGKYNGKRGKEWASLSQHKFNTEEHFYNVYNEDIGNYAEDNLWPWDFDQVLSRPMRFWDLGNSRVPQINITFPNTITSSYPEGPLTIKSTIDYQDRINNQITLGFDYDDIPYFDSDKKLYCEKPMEGMESVETHNQNFLNVAIPVSERIEAANNAFLREEEDLALALEILSNKNEEELIRLKSVQLLDHTKEQFLDAAIEIIPETDEPIELRSALIHYVFASKRFNRYFSSRRPRFFDILRGLITDSNQQLRIQSIDILAAHEDEVVQSFLREEIRKEESEFISKQDAIFFLRQNTKPQHADLFREIFEGSTDIDVRKAAIEGLDQDPELVGFLQEVVMNKREDFKVREAGAFALHHINHEIMNDLAAQIISEPERESPNILFTNATPDPSEVDFKAGLLNMLAFTGNIDHLRQNENLRASLNRVTNESLDNRANFLSSFETSADTPAESPTIIEKMATELLNRLNRIDEDE
ncbi:MAG: tyrosinase family protein [Bacteroidota bacterium]